MQLPSPTELDVLDHRLLCDVSLAKQARLQQQQQQGQAGDATRADGQAIPRDQTDGEDRLERSPLPTPRTEPDDREPSTQRERSSAKRPRLNEEVVRTYAPQWGVLSTDSVLNLCPKEAKKVGPDLCRGLILPEDRQVYEETDPMAACTEMLALLSMAVPWAASVTDKMQAAQSRLGQAKDLELRAARAEASLERANLENDRLNGQASVLKADRDKLQTEVATLRARVQRRNDQLRTARKAVRKGQKQLELTEDRCFAMGFEDAVLKAHAADLDHKLILGEGDIDPVGREAVPDEAPMVPSEEDEALSEELLCLFSCLRACNFNSAFGLKLLLPPGL